MENCFWCYFRQLFISLAFRKCKKDCNIFEIILVLIFVHQKLKLLDFQLFLILKFDSLASLSMK